MGRHKKSVSAQKNVDDFNVDKDEMLSVFNREKRGKGLSQETINLYKIRPKGSPAKLSGNKIIQINEKSYEASLIELHSWEKKYNEDVLAHNKKVADKKLTMSLIELVDYYPIEFMSKSILASYKYQHE